MSFVNDSQMLIEIILDKAIEALSAERGSLMIYNEQIDKLEVRVVRGFHGEVKSYTKFSPGEGIAGKVFTSKQPLMVNYGENDPMFKKSNIPDRKTTINCMLCVPIKSKDHVLGVINIINKISSKENYFNVNDMELLEAISSHAAVTLENARLYEQSITDGMTKLYIHRYFQLRLDEEINRANRYNGPLSLIMFDIYHFKTFNDTYGHQTGDLVLKEVAKVIKNTIRKDVDIAARYGGEEFAVIVPETPATQAFNLAERLRKNVAALELPGPGGQVLSVTISLGISEYPCHSDNKMGLIKAADMALYYSKENGRNQSNVFDPDKMKDES
jgi:diguanylate cyclase (GGDEF)-like protein